MELAKTSTELKALESMMDLKAPLRKALLHQAVVTQMEWRRRITAKAKSRNEVKGTSKKSVKQKGTGGARHGNLKAPIFVGGGVAHGPKGIPRKYKMNRGAFRMATLESVRARLIDDKLHVLKSDSSTGKTKEVATFLKKNKLNSVLFCVGKDSKLMQATRNLPKTKSLRFEAVNPYDVMCFEHLILSPEGIQHLTETMKKNHIEMKGTEK